MPRSRGRRTIDLAIVATALLYLGAMSVFGLVLWSDLGGKLAAPAAEFVAAFSAFNRTVRAVLVPLGSLAVVLVLVALLLEGTVRGWRSGLRLVGVVVMVLTGLLNLAVLEPLGDGVVSAAAGRSAERTVALLVKWQNWQVVVFVLAAAAVCALVAAHWARPTRPLSVSAGGLTEHHRAVLVLVGAVTLFEGYDRFIVSLALPSIARDLSASEGDLGWSLAAIRVGALFAVLLGRAADRFGRRRLLMVTVLGYTIATGATGLSGALAAFILFQIVALAFLGAELSVAQVVIAEEFPAGARGRGQGLLGAAAGLGAALALMLFPVMEATRLGWRGLYFVGLAPLLLIAFLRRSLPETERWRRTDGRLVASARIWSVLGRAHRWGFTILMLVTASATAAAGPAFAFASYRAVTTLGWSAPQVSAMMLVGGGLGFSGWLVLGWLCDRVGRRPTALVSLVGGALATIAFYSTAYLLPAFTALVFFESGATISINALSTEIFPTALRATAKSWVTSAAVIGAMAGLAGVGALAEKTGGHAVVVAAIALAPALLAPSLFFLPETRGRELEETSVMV